MGSLVIGTSDAGTVLDDDMEEGVRAALNRATSGIADVLLDERDQVFDAAYSRWPVRTGRSKRDLIRTTVITDDVLEVGVGNRNSGGYVFYVWIRGVNSAWVELLRRPMKEAEERALDRLDHVLTDAFVGL